ncbi:MAG: DUF4175 family protein [Bacteroidota bacterium]
MNQHQQLLDQRLKEFRKKYYTDRIIRGSLILLLVMSSIAFVALLSEGLFGFSAQVRTGMVFLLGGIFLAVLGYMVLLPMTKIMDLGSTISDWQIGQMVQRFFPNVNDKLLNFLELRSSAPQGNTLAAAALDQKAGEIAPVHLSQAINLNVNRKYLWFLLIPLLSYLVTFLINPAFLTSSSHRLLNYNESFIPPPPFTISVENLPEELIAGNDFQLDVKVEGDQLPAELFVYVKSNEDENAQFIDYGLDRNSPVSFSYRFTEVKEGFSFYIGNADGRSEVYNLNVLRRPFIRNFKIKVTYPAYTGLAPESFEANVGDIKVLKGARATWELQAQGEIEQALFVTDKGEEAAFEKSEDGNFFNLNKRLLKEFQYMISLTSTEDIQNVDTVNYRVNILQDRYPSIYIFSPTNDFLVDLDPVMPLDLEIADDFGFSKMEMGYKFVKSGGTSAVTDEFQSYPLAFDAKTLLQKQAYEIDLTRLGLSEGDEIEFFVKVWDNDGVSGPKEATSATFKAVYPTLDAKYEEATAKQDEVKESLAELKKTSESLKESYKKMQEKLLNQKNLNFDDKKEIQQILQEHQEMLEEMKQAEKNFEEAKEKLQENQMISEQTLDKYEELNEFMEELDNPEIEKMIEELQERLEELNTEEIKEQLDQLQFNDEDMQKSLERTLELLKQLEVQQKIDEVRNKLDNLAAKQQVLEEKTQEAESSEELDNLEDRQEDLNEQMEGIQEDLNELDDMKSDTETPDEDGMKDIKDKGEETKSEMENASEKLDEASKQQEEGGRKNKKEANQQQQQAGQSQKKSAQKMQEMSEQLSQMQMNMQSSQDQQNLEQLRELIENLLTLSFDQEDLRNDVKELKYGDPSLKDKSQNQKKLQDDMGLVKDSLDALANRMFGIQKFVLDESENIESSMKRSQTFFRNKQTTMINYHQQEAMTSMNNLANMLSQAMSDLQSQMKNAMAGQQMCDKPNGQKPNMQGIGKQQQQLNKQMQQMMKPGQMNSDQLNKMAAQQRAIRKQLEEAQQKMKGSNGKPLGDMGKVMEDMKETESDLINKQLTRETLKRQQDILSRLLQADQSVREREMDKKRESKTGKEFVRKSPDELTVDELKSRIRQEMLKSNKLEYSNDFLILIEQYYKKLERRNE